MAFRWGNDLVIICSKRLLSGYANGPATISGCLRSYTYSILLLRSPRLIAPVEMVNEDDKLLIQPSGTHVRGDTKDVFECSLYGSLLCVCVFFALQHHLSLRISAAK